MDNIKYFVVKFRQEMENNFKFRSNQHFLQIVIDFNHFL